MAIERKWAFWRRVQYGTGFSVVCLSFLLLIYFSAFHTPASCFDGRTNGGEAGVDCGGACARICAFAVTPPVISWAQSFRVADGQYNAVAYIENRNQSAATPELPYTFVLYEGNDVIAERTGTTVLPPDSEYPVFEGRIAVGNRVPTRTEIMLGDATMWLPASVGRNQFRVNSRELFDVDSRPRLEAIIENRELFESKEVEVVATIFDSRGNPLTVSRTFIDNFAARSTETAVFTWPEPIATTLRSCEVPTDIVAAIDLSGSMNNDADNPPEPISSVLAAAQSFVARLQTADQVGVVTFATEALVAEPLTSSLTKAATTISRLVIDPAEETGSTNTGDAILRATEELTSDRHNTAARKVLVLLTDGLATAPDEAPEQYAHDAATAAKAAGVIVYTIGLGEQVNMDFVRQLATSPDNAYQAISRSQVDDIYSTITGNICEDGAAVIDIVPKTTASFSSLQ